MLSYSWSCLYCCSLTPKENSKVLKRKWRCNYSGNMGGGCKLRPAFRDYYTQSKKEEEGEGNNIKRQFSSYRSLQKISKDFHFQERKKVYQMNLKVVGLPNQTKKLKKIWFVASEGTAAINSWMAFTATHPHLSTHYLFDIIN